MARQVLASVHGIRHVYAGIMDPETGRVVTGSQGLAPSGVATLSGDKQGTTAANITAIEEKGNKEYADNQVKRISHGVAAPEVAFTFLDIPLEVKRKMLGQTKSQSGLSYVTNTNIKPAIAIIIEVDDQVGNKQYTAFANGEMIEPTENHGTDTNNKTNANVTITYDALAPIDDNTFIDNTGMQQIVGAFSSADPDFTEQKMFDEVFLGNTMGKEPNTPSADLPFTINVHYQDDQGSNIASLTDASLTGKKGDQYKIETPQTPGYEYVKCSVPLEGTFTQNESALVTYTKATSDNTK